MREGRAVDAARIASAIEEAHFLAQCIGDLAVRARHDGALDGTTSVVSCVISSSAWCCGRRGSRAREHVQAALAEVA